MQSAPPVSVLVDPAESLLTAQQSALRSSDVIDGSDNSQMRSDSYSASRSDSDEEMGGVTHSATRIPAMVARASSAAALPVSAELAARRERRRQRQRHQRRPQPLPHDSDERLDAKAIAQGARSRHSDDACACCVRWMGPGSAVLWLFTLCQLLIFYDRGMVAGFLPAIQAELGGLSDTQMGLMGSGFIFGYMLACPLFAFFSKTYSPYKLMAVGLFLWVMAVTLCGLTDNFITLLGARILTGVGEASFAGLAPTCIDDVAPLRHRTIWLSFFFAGIPIGSALGYIAGGWFSAAEGLGWHWGFLSEAVLMCPVVLIVFLWPNHVEAAEEAQREAEATQQAIKEARRARQRKPAWQTREAPVYPIDTGAATVPEATVQQQAEGEASPVAPLKPRPLTVVPVISRSISTPALKRMEGSGTWRRTADADTLAQAGVETKQQPQQPQQPQSYGSTNISEPRAPSVPPSPSSSSRPLTLTMPPSPIAASGPRGPSMPYRPVRTPAMSSQSYIVPADPNNPFHAPGQHYRPVEHTVTTPHEGWGGGGMGGFFDDDEDEDSALLLDPTASLPSPSSFNPHYDLQQWEATQNDDMFLTDVVTLLTDRVYIVVVLGYAALAFVIGALSFWAPVDFSATLHISIARSTQIIGVITFTCGLAGTFFGGWMLDYRGSGKGIFAVIRALELSVAFVALSIIFALGAVLTLDLTTSMFCLALADFFLFGTGPPINAALLSVAPKNMRSLAMAMSILLMHALGDLPSPFLMGYITDQVNSIQLALVILCLWLLWTVAFWVLGVRLARKRAEEFKAALSRDMARPAHERTALLARRGSTGQFYASDAAANSGRDEHVGRAKRAGTRAAHKSGGDRQSTGGLSVQSSGHHTQRTGTGTHHSGPTTPGSSGGSTGRRARSTTHTPQQQYRRSAYQPTHHYQQHQSRSGSASPSVSSRSLAAYPHEDTFANAFSGPPQQAQVNGNMLPIFSPAGEVLGYAQAPSQQQQQLQQPQITYEQQQAALAFAGAPIATADNKQQLE